MKKSNIYIILALLLAVNINSFAQSDKENAIATLKAYKSALENLDLTGSSQLFTENSEILESGSVEGTYENYLDHHIGPELGEFESFKYDNYIVNVNVDGEYAFATETYKYVIVLKEDNRTIERQGAATSVLHKENGIWKIMKLHSSSRAVKK